MGDLLSDILEKVSNHDNFFKTGTINLEKSILQNVKSFVEGFLMLEETFFQMHSYSSLCNAGPPLMLKISNEKLIIQTRRRNSSAHFKGYTKIKLSDLIGKWNSFRIILDLSQKPALSLNLNGKQILSNRIFGIKKCGALHFKFGIYRPGNLLKKNLRSVVDFDKIILKKIN